MLVCQLNWLDNLSDLFSSFLRPSVGYQGRQSGIFSGAYEITWALYKLAGKRKQPWSSVAETFAHSLGIIGVLCWEDLTSRQHLEQAAVRNILHPPPLSCSLQSLLLYKLTHSFPSSSSLLIRAVPFSVGQPSVTSTAVKSTGSFVTNTGPWFTLCTGQRILKL